MMRIKEWNDLVTETMEYMEHFRTSICGFAPGCGHGHCNCGTEDLVEVYELEEGDVIRLLEKVTA